MKKQTPRSHCCPTSKCFLPKNTAGNIAENIARSFPGINIVLSAGCSNIK
ncbi:MAG: hypothetical protein SGI96_15150 [Bacteroidota bacterium]|nr:hypothetical protein [Bacteroidota bacterium]